MTQITIIVSSFQLDRYKIIFSRLKWALIIPGLLKLKRFKLELCDDGAHNSKFIFLLCGKALINVLIHFQRHEGVFVFCAFLHDKVQQNAFSFILSSYSATFFGKFGY